jgi:hypothetical protein
MKLQIENLKKQQDKIMRKVRGAEKKVDKVEAKIAEKVDVTKIKMVYNFYLTSRDSSPSLPQRRTPGTSERILAREQDGNTLPGLPPPPTD